MGTLTSKANPTAREVGFTATELVVSLTDGRTICVPLAWYARLAKASAEQLQDYELLGDGDGIHWPQLDEDLSVKGLLQGSH
ncbi:MAG TPA: DUF2442 domain-containing protein [Halieaceae bacterium]|nr:DUF2442 domain-containing protein [Halieaceae bacterium]